MQDEQRTRILEATAEAASARGIDGGSVTAEEIIERAGVSSEAFYVLFIDRDACFLAACELALARAHKRTVVAYDAEPRWLDAVKAGLAELLRFIEDEPQWGRLLIVYSMSGSEQLLRRRARVLTTLAEVVDRGRHEAPVDRQQPAAIVGEGVVGAVIAVLQNRLLRADGAEVIELFGSLTSIIALPYLGVGVARRELTRPVPPVRVPGAGLGPVPEGLCGSALNFWSDGCRAVRSGGLWWATWSVRMMVGGCRTGCGSGWRGCCRTRRFTRWVVMRRGCPIVTRWTRSCWCSGRGCSGTR